MSFFELPALVRAVHTGRVERLLAFSGVGFMGTGWLLFFEGSVWGVLLVVVLPALLVRGV